ncbi:MAG: LamB/YcsF family protein [Candidatus Puniceispirillales bacterium]
MALFNLNADMAEGYGPWTMGDDEGLLDIIQTANIACGFHAGDANIMARVMAAAHDKGVSIGAHPGFQDLHGFGRRQLRLSMAEIENLIAYQLGAALAMADLVGAQVTHVKPHGALNNMAAVDTEMAGAIARAIKAVDPQQIMLAPVLSAMVTAGQDAGLIVVEEVFADRAYMPDGQLAPRSRPDAMIHDPEKALTHCLRMLMEGEILTLDGSRLKTSGRSICVHGDEPSALAMAGFIRKGLEAEGLSPAPLPDLAV